MTQLNSWYQLQQQSIKIELVAMVETYATVKKLSINNTLKALGVPRAVYFRYKKQVKCL